MKARPTAPCPPCRVVLLTAALTSVLAACEKERPPSAPADVLLPPTDSPAEDTAAPSDDTPDTGSADGATPDDAQDTGSADGALDATLDATQDAPADGPADTGSGGDGATDGGETGPLPPRLLAPLSGTHTLSRRPTFRWATAAGAARYRVELSTTRSFAVVDASFEATSTSGAPSTDVGPGLRFWRVVSLGADGARGRPGAVWEVTTGHAPSDVNGDGRSEVVVGAPNVNVGGVGTGRVYVFLGSSTLDADADVTLTGETPGGYFGTSVATGDLNGDGFEDVVVGAPYAGTSSAGRVYVFLGSATPGSMDRPAVVLNGAAAMGAFGQSVAVAGDVNGDGFEDVVVGAPFVSSNTGQAFVYFGGATLDATPDVALTYAAAGDQFGASVSGAGDVDGDGYADVIVGAPRHDGPRGEDSGGAFVFLGGERVDALPDRTVTGEALRDLFGTSVSGAGDVNGNGFADVIVGAPEHDTGGDNAGRAYLFLGLDAPGTPSSTVLRGAAARDTFGRAVAGVGDLDGDGFDDVAVGAPGANVVASASPTGRAYVFLGGAVPDSAPDLTFTGMTGGDAVGTALASGGDADGDSFADALIAGTYAPFTGRGGPGSVYLFRGGASLSTTPSQRYSGATGSDQFGVGLVWRWRSPRRAPRG